MITFLYVQYMKLRKWKEMSVTDCLESKISFSNVSYCRAESENLTALLLCLFYSIVKKKSVLQLDLSKKIDTLIQKNCIELIVICKSTNSAIIQTTIISCLIDKLAFC